MGGYEGADHVNDRGVPLDMTAANGHLAQLEADHARAAALGIRTVRESVGWRLTEVAPGRFDLARVRRIAASARRHGLQVLWTLMHYGTPGDVRLDDDAAIDRFAAFATAVGREIAGFGDAPPVYNPVNEISFLAWAVSHTALIHPYGRDGAAGGDASGASGYAVKRRLVRMALAGIDALRAIDPRSRFLHVEPLLHVVTPADRPELADLAARIAGYQWQAWDLLAGRVEPGLGGTPEALDLIGINHYHSSQWEAVTEERLWWHRRDPRRAPFGDLVADCWGRYGRPMIVAETSHLGEGRAQWLHEMAAEVRRVRGDGVPVDGMCLYPLVDRPDWSEPGHWHDSGLWDVDRTRPGLRRVPCPEYVAALRGWQACLPAAAGRHPRAKPLLLVFSHLRWDFLVQRPQQLMTRLAREWTVLVVEEPLPLAPATGPARLETISHGPDIEVLLPRTAVAASGFEDAQADVLQPLLAAELRRRGAPCVVAWLCTPLALPLAAALGPRRIVYDCMDEMSGFANAPAAMRPRELALLQSADLVIAAGPTLQRLRQRDGGRPVRCVPNGVDAAAFAAAALDPGSAQAGQTRRLPPATGPRLGYLGAVDERVDLALVAALADARPGWQLVMAGPVLKIDTGTLPQRPNLHWLGHQPPVRLPYLLATWDVCLMPFVDSPVTRAMNPVKTLEYMAAGKPIVATPVPDVALLHAGLVTVAASPAAFVAACEAALGEAPATRRRRVAAMREAARHASWDARAAQVAALLVALIREPPAAVPPRHPFLPALPASPTDAARGLAYRGATNPHERRTMSHSSILGGESAAARASGRDADLLGPSDTSDSGSDVQGERAMPTGADNPGELGAVTTGLDSDSDASGTGERGAAAGDDGRDGGDILPDRIVDGADVDGDLLLDAVVTDVEAIGDDEDDAADDDAPILRDVAPAEVDAGEPSGRVFTLPPGTLESAEER